MISSKLQGICQGQGTFAEMASSGVDFASLLKTDKEEEEKIKEEEKRLLQRLESVASSTLHSPSPSEVGSTFSLTSIGADFEVRIRTCHQEQRYCFCLVSVHLPLSHCVYVDLTKVFILKCIQLLEEV